MLHVEITSPTALTDSVLEVLDDDPGVTGLAVHRQASLRPAGDVVSADLPRESANHLLQMLLDTGVQRDGAIRVNPVPTWVSQPAYAAMVEAPGLSPDAVVWPEVVQRAYDDTELSWSYLTFMTLATLIASIAIVLDSQILVIGAMVLGPEFGAIAALGVALLRGRRTLLAQAIRTLAVGFAVAIALTTLAALVGRATGWVTIQDVVGPRPLTAFIYSPDGWSFLVSVIAGIAGVLSLTSAKTGGLAGVFISVTTIPAAGNVALAIAFGVWSEMLGSAGQLLLNITGMALAGLLTLTVQKLTWSRVRHQGRARRWPVDHPSRS